MFQKLIGKSKPEPNPTATIEKLTEILEMLEKREDYFAKNAAVEVKKILTLEGAKATTLTIDALRTGAASMKAISKSMNINDLDKTMHEINEQTESMKQIQETLSAPVGASVDFDEDKLEAELGELEGAYLQEQLLQPAKFAPVPVISLPSSMQPAHPIPQKTTADEIDELSALQTEMAL
ncbi:hypothetical protein CRYUN_Cryun33cG0087600 [Craigia yunnanensis]